MNVARAIKKVLNKQTTNHIRIVRINTNDHKEVCQSKDRPSQHKHIGQTTSTTFKSDIYNQITVTSSIEINSTNSTSEITTATTNKDIRCKKSAKFVPWS